MTIKEVCLMVSRGGIRLTVTGEHFNSVAKITMVVNAVVKNVSATEESTIRQREYPSVRRLQHLVVIIRGHIAATGLSSLELTAGLKHVHLEIHG